MHKNSGNIVITVLIVLILLSVSTLYSARESLWAIKVSHTEKQSLQLDMLVPQLLLKVEQLINQLPANITPHPDYLCTSACVVLPREGNYYLEVDLKPLKAAYILSWPSLQAWVILEYLGEDIFRSSFLLLSFDQPTQLRMQATWKKTTLNSNILSLR